MYFVYEYMAGEIKDAWQKRWSRMLGRIRRGVVQRAKGGSEGNHSK